MGHPGVPAGARAPRAKTGLSQNGYGHYYYYYYYYYDYYDYYDYYLAILPPLLDKNPLQDKHPLLDCARATRQ